MDALRAASDRCEAVLCLISPDWLKSRWCMTEFLLARSLHKRILAAVVAPVPLDALPVEMTAEWQLCDLVGADPQRTFQVAAATVSFREAGLDLLRRGLQRVGLDARGFVWPPPGDPDRAPYRGLRALEAEDAPIFFGRDAAVVRGMDQLRGMADLGVDRLMLVLGASGAGKSSFLRAGLWPLLARDDAHFLPLPVIRPLDAVISGSAGLAVSLSGAFARLGVARPPGPVKAALAAGGAAALAAMLDEVGRLAQARLVHVEAGARPPVVVIPVDQAEELFNSEGAAEAELFLSLLVAVLSGPRRVLVVGTIRTDRYHRMQSEALLPGVRRVLFDLSPISPSDYRQVIEGPAGIMQAGPRTFAIDPALTERLIADATGADALPLLAFTLERLWADYGAHVRLTLDDYVSMGGVQGSIEAAVAGALARPDQAPAIPADTAAQNAALRAAFIPWLARVDPVSRQALRRPARMEDIPVSSRAVVDRFVAARLLLADRRDGVDVIEVAHESLLRQWPRLVAWLDADAADLAQMEEVERAAAEWARNGRRDEWLDHRADRLAAAEALLRREDFRARLGEIGAAYVAAARALTERERAARELALARTARAQHQAWWALSGLALFLAVGLSVALFQHRANLAMRGQLDARQATLDRTSVNRLTEVAALKVERGALESALRIEIWTTQFARSHGLDGKTRAVAESQFAGTLWQTRWHLMLAGHHDAVLSASYSPDGTRVVTASKDRTARIWNSLTGSTLVVLRGHMDRVASAAYSPNGKYIVTASDDGTARVWDAASGQQPAVLSGHRDAVLSAAYSPDGTRIVTASRDFTARVWDAKTGHQILALTGHNFDVESAGYSPDGMRILTASLDQTALIWDAMTGKQIGRLGDDTTPFYSAYYSPDGRQVVTTTDEGIQTWDAKSGKGIAAFKGTLGKRVRSAMFNPDSTQIVGAGDNSLQVWDVKSGRQLADLPGSNSGVNEAAYSPDGRHIVSASYDGTARIWDQYGTDLAVLTGEGIFASPKLSAVYSPDGRHIAVGPFVGSPEIWDPVTGKPALQFEGSFDRVYFANYSPDGSRIVAPLSDNKAGIWNATTGHQLVAFSGHTEEVLCANFSPDGGRIVTASADGTARIWNSISGIQIQELTPHGGAVRFAAYNRAGTRLVTASADGTAQIWDAASFVQVGTLVGHTAAVNAAAYSPDDKEIVTASDDNTLRTWDAQRGVQRLILRGHTDAVNTAVYSPDGRRILSASADRTARVWDTASGRQMALLGLHADIVRSATYSEDQTRILTASDDGTARIWDARALSLTLPEMLSVTCTRRLNNSSTLTADEMTLIGEDPGRHGLDVCAGVALPH